MIQKKKSNRKDKRQCRIMQTSKTSFNNNDQPQGDLIKLGLFNCSLCGLKLVEITEIALLAYFDQLQVKQDLVKYGPNRDF